jgi:ferredoxin
MSRGDFHKHFVTTRGEARRLTAGREAYWVSSCGCREEQAEARGGRACARSRIDCCLHWHEGAGSSSNGVRRVSPEEVVALFAMAEELHLVTRPFRDEAEPSRVDGVCFCCDDCCWYFTSDEEHCDFGQLVERTDALACTACGACEEVCHFGARKLGDESVEVARDLCGGCGGCLDVCPASAIEMVARTVSSTSEIADRI